MSQASPERCEEGDDDAEGKRRRTKLSATILGRFATGLVGRQSSGKTSALRGNRLCVTSAQTALLDVVDVSNPRFQLRNHRIGGRLTRRPVHHRCIQGYPGYPLGEADGSAANWRHRGTRPCAGMRRWRFSEIVSSITPTHGATRSSA